MLLSKPPRLAAGAIGICRPFPDERYEYTGGKTDNMYDLHKNPIGIYEKALPDSFSWPEKLEAAKEAGFDYMEISVDESDERLARLDWTDAQIDELRAVSEKTGIWFPSMCLSGHRRYPFGSKDLAVRAKAMEIMEKAIDLCVKLGVHIIQLATYDVYYEPADEETEKLFTEGMRQAVAMASRAGVILAMEIMDTQFVGNIVRAYRYLRKIPSPYFKIYPDIGNLSNFSMDVGAELELGLPETVAIHIKETKPGIFKSVPFGEGQVEFVKIFRKLREIRYHGMFLIEMWADNDPAVTRETAIRTISDARRFVLDKMHEADG